MENIKILRVGSIIQLIGNTKKIMIVGRCLMVNDRNNQHYSDYAGVYYPEGILDENLIYFNNDSILRVLDSILRVLSSPPPVDGEEDLTRCIKDIISKRKTSKEELRKNNSGRK